MEGGMKRDRRRLLRIFFLDYLDHEDILQAFTNNGDPAAHLLFLLLGPAEDDLPLLPDKEKDYTLFQLSLHIRLQGKPDWSNMHEQVPTSYAQAKEMFSDLGVATPAQEFLFLKELSELHHVHHV
jgi:hypothetical protein